MRAPWRKNQSFEINLKVSAIMDHERHQWKRQKLEEFFYPGDIEIISRMKPAWNDEDSWIWSFNKSGDFSVKSAYWLGSQSNHNQRRMEAEIQPSLNILKEKVWKVKTEPKIVNFLWKSLNDALPVDDGLAARGMKVDGICQLCGCRGESINHALFSCSFARQVWATSGIPSPRRGFDEDSVYANINFLLLLETRYGNVDVEIKAWPWVIWNIWKKRNKFLFENCLLDAVETSSVGREEAMLWFYAQTCTTEIGDIEHTQASVDNGKWRRPQESWEKCNIGVFWCKHRLLAGGAWVLRNDRGQVIMHSRRAFAQIHDLDAAKLLILNWAIDSMKEHRREKIEFAMDDKVLVQAVKKRKAWPAFKAQGDEIRRRLSHFVDWKLVGETKNANSGAQLIASSVSCSHLRQSYVALEAPDWLDDLFAGEATEAALL